MKRALTLLLVCTLAAPVEAGVMPWVNASSVSERAPEETSLWHEADEFDQALARASKINSDPALTVYLQGIMDRLYPEFKGRLRVHLLNAQHINAFALPNGSVYVNAGLIARFQNEAQLATVMAHEGAHFTHRHSLQQAEQAKNARPTKSATSGCLPPATTRANRSTPSSICSPRSRPTTFRNRSFLPAIPNCRNASTTSASCRKMPPAAKPRVNATSTPPPRCASTRSTPTSPPTATSSSFWC